jgi:hypothetical protein
MKDTHEMKVGNGGITCAERRITFDDRLGEPSAQVNCDRVPLLLACWTGPRSVGEHCGSAFGLPMNCQLECQWLSCEIQQQIAGHPCDSAARVTMPFVLGVPPSNAR